MFQMTTLALQAHLEPTSKVVNHFDTLFLPDSPNLLGDGHFQFSNGLRTILIDVVLQESPEKKSGGLRSGECGDHLGSCLLLISRSGNRLSSHSIVMLAVGVVAPFCWNHCTPRLTPRRDPSALQNLLSTVM